MVRKIIKSKSGSYIVVLPKEWINSLKLRYGVIPMEVDVQIMGDEIKIQPIIHLRNEIHIGTVTVRKI